MYFILFFLNDMFRSIKRHQAIFTKLKIRCMKCKYHSCNMEFHKTYTNVLNYVINSIECMFLKRVVYQSLSTTKQLLEAQTK